jgi:hypothetical protein
MKPVSIHWSWDNKPIYICGNKKCGQGSFWGNERDFIPKKSLKKVNKKKRAGGMDRLI